MPCVLFWKVVIECHVICIPLFLMRMQHFIIFCVLVVVCFYHLSIFWLHFKVFLLPFINMHHGYCGSVVVVVVVSCWRGYSCLQTVAVISYKPLWWATWWPKTTTVQTCQGKHNNSLVFCVFCAPVMPCICCYVFMELM